MAREIPHATPGYRVFPERPATVEAARARVREAGYDSVVIIGITGVDRERSLVPGPPAWHPYEDKLVWFARSDSLNSSSLAAALRETVRANAAAAAQAIRQARP